MNGIESLTADMSAASPRPKKQFARVQMLLVQMGTITFTILVMYLLPLSLSSSLLMLLYAGILWVEYRYGVYSPISFTLLTMSVGLFFGHTYLETSGYEAHVPILLFGALFAVSLALLLIGRPATSFYGGQSGFSALHWRTSSLWAVTYAVGMLAGLIVLRHPGLFWLTPGAILVGVALTLWFQLIDMGASWRRPRSFKLGEYRFEQISSDREHLRPFYRHFLREALPSVRAGTGPKNESYEDLLTLAMDIYADSWSKATFFLAYHGEDVVGTIYSVPGNRASLSFEKDYPAPFSLNGLRQYGRVVDVNFLSISKSHRFGQDLIQGLLRCAIEFAMENDASFLVTQSYQSALPIYRKIGFIPLAEDIVQTRLGVASVLIGFNLARRVVCEADVHQVSSKLESVMAPYVAERYFKRQVVRAMFRRKQAWRLSDVEMVALVTGQ